MASIYRILNLQNNKFYIGSTLVRLSSRKSQHLYLLRNNKHCNKHLQSSYNLYGEENLQFIEIEQITFPETYSKEYKTEYILLRELYFIENLNPEYNQAKETKPGSFGTKMSKEHYKYMRENYYDKWKGKPVLKKQEHIDKMLNALRTRKLSDSSIKKMSEYSRKNFYKVKDKLALPETKRKAVENRLLIMNNREKYHGEEGSKRLKKSQRELHKKQFDVFDVDGVYINTFNNLREAEEILSIPYRTIWASLNRKSKSGKIIKSIRKYIFKYKEVSIG